jgi:hypothetical protein
MISIFAKPKAPSAPNVGADLVETQLVAALSCTASDFLVVPGFFFDRDDFDAVDIAHLKVHRLLL